MPDKEKLAGDVTINGRTALFAMFLFAGGGVTGGGVSWFQSAGPEVRELTERVAALEDAVADLRDTVQESERRRNDERWKENERRFEQLEKRQRGRRRQ